eukprot:TRINITY_DN4151_c0_g2_i3.p1 TRINITY_DN4151_c0_g2~~TRINITY_DN4151_c0_g2_i3.p1  ORF type:complete len:415 (-),score=82.93 TRINITY_DN4151_c0_g2_i3:411-1655(-)
MKVMMLLALLFAAAAAQVGALELESRREEPDVKKALREIVEVVNGFAFTRAGTAEPDVKKALREIVEEVNGPAFTGVGKAGADATVALAAGRMAETSKFNPDAKHVKAIRTVIDSLQADINNQRRHFQTKISNLTSAFKHCRSEMESAITNAQSVYLATPPFKDPNPNTANSVNPYQQCITEKIHLEEEWKLCLSDQKVLKFESRHACGDFHKATPADSPFDAQCKANIADTLPSSYEELLEQKVAELKHWRALRKQCNASEVAHSKKILRCNAKAQKVFDAQKRCNLFTGAPEWSAECERYHSLSSACAEYGKCYNEAVAQHSSDVALASATMTRLKTEFHETHRIECFLKVLKDEMHISKCLELKTSSIPGIKGLDLVVPETPEKAVCHTGEIPAACPMKNPKDGIAPVGLS